MKNSLAAAVLAPLLLALAGCATPEGRIKKNPELFDALPPDVQAQVRKGQVGIGFSQDAVFLALGKPDRMYTRQAEAGTTEIWSWVSYTTTRDRQQVQYRGRVRDSKGVSHAVSDTIWVDVDTRNEYEKLRVEIRDKKVFAIERVQR